MSISRNTTSTRIAWFSKQMFSVGDAATYLGLSTSTVRRRIAAGALRAQRWGRSWMLWRADLDWYLHEGDRHRRQDARLRSSAICLGTAIDMTSAG